MTTRGRKASISTQNEIHDAIWVRCESIFRQLVDQFAIEHIALNFVRSDNVYSEDEPWVAATTESKWQYRQAKIVVYVATIANHTDDDIRGILVHELVHVLVDPLESMMSSGKHVTARCELAVENVAQALMRALAAE